MIVILKWKIIECNLFLLRRQLRHDLNAIYEIENDSFHEKWIFQPSQTTYNVINIVSHDDKTNVLLFDCLTCPLTRRRHIKKNYHIVRCFFSYYYYRSTFNSRIIDFQ